jgi:hypothetical protein
MRYNMTLNIAKYALKTCKKRNLTVEIDKKVPTK